MNPPNLKMYITRQFELKFGPGYNLLGLYPLLNTWEFAAVVYARFSCQTVFIFTLYDFFNGIPTCNQTVDR